MTMTKAQFSAAYALARYHGHYWAVKARPAVWAAARAAARLPWKESESSTRTRADEAAAVAAREADEDSSRAEAARTAEEAVWAAFDAARRARAAVKAADNNYTEPEIGPEGPEDYEACLLIATVRDEQGWGGVELPHSTAASGDIHHTTCSGSTSWTIETDGWVTVRRLDDDGETVASATVSPGGRSYEIEPGAGTLQDMRRLAECLRALGCERGARNALLLANPAELSSEIARLEGCAAEAAKPSSGWGTPPESYTRAALPLRAALDVLYAGFTRQQYAAKRAAYLGS